MSDTVETEAPAEAPADTSVRGSLEAAFAEVEARDPSAPATEAPEGETETQRDERLRDERGRFARAEAAEAPETEEAPAEGAEKAAEPPAAATKEPPPLWTAADKETFRKMPPEVQDIWLRREQEQQAHFTRQTQTIAAFRRDFEPVAGIFEPHRDIMREKGFTPASLVKGWVETEGGLMNPKTAPQVAARIIKGYQIPPEAVMQALGWQPPQGSVHVDPGEMSAPHQQIPIPPEGLHYRIPPELLAHLNGLTEKVQTWEQRQQQEREYHHQQATSRVVSEIERFKNETGPNGMPLRPYFAELEDDMAMLAQLAVKRGGDTPPLQELYDTAVRANPLTYQRLRAEETAAQEAQRMAKEKATRDEARARAAKAQRASSPVTGAPRTGHAGPQNGPVSVRDSIIAAMDAHS